MDIFCSYNWSCRFVADDGICHIFRWVALLPIKIVLYYTVPNCRKPRQVFKRTTDAPAFKLNWPQIKQLYVMLLQMRNVYLINNKDKLWY